MENRIEMIHSQGKEPEIRMADRGFASVTRIFQLEIDGNGEPEINIFIPAGKAVNDDRMWYHIISENAYGLDPNGEYALMPKDEAEKYFNCKIEEDTPNDIVDKIKSGDLSVIACAFSQIIRVVHVSDETFENIAPAISNQPIDVDFMKKQRYFHVMTNAGLVIFKKIDK